MVAATHVTLAAIPRDSSPEDQAAFFLAGVAALTARRNLTARVSIGFADRALSFEVEAASSFRELTAQARSVLHSDIGAADNETCDAVLVMSGQTTSAPHVNAPLYTVTTDGATWSVVLALDGEQSVPAQTTRTLAAFACLLEDAATRPDTPVNRLRLIREQDALALYAELNRTESAIPPGTVLDLVAVASASRGAKEAVVFADRAISYEQLQTRSDALARNLMRRGADQSRPIAICLERSENVPLLQLAAMKAGSFYVPLDPAHPRQRLLDMVAECRPAVIIASEQSAPLFTGAGTPVNSPRELEAEAQDTSELPSVNATDLAYMIYTSGTTGRPKGVTLTHHSLVNLLHGTGNLIRETDRLLAVASFAFDISGLDMFLPLVQGATVVIAPDSAVGDPWQLLELVKQQNISFLQATPVTWRMLLAAGFRSAPRMTMLSGGEALARDLANNLLLNGGALWNGYGPTETTIYSSMVWVQNGTGPVIIGPPMPNTRFYVVDEAGQLLPPEFAGELYIGGSGVASGYLDRPDLTAERFLTDTWAVVEKGQRDDEDAFPKPRLFRTGDLVRWLPESQNGFQIFGRLDHQVKLRGYRIELSEIEAVLRSENGVADAAVLLREDEPGEPWLVGYCARKPNATIHSPALMEAAAKRLPRYMLPSRLVLLDSLPLTGSGKVDRRALASLPAPEDHADLQATPPLEPIDAIETSLLRIFREVLKSKTFGMDDDFFRYGGYSMQAIRLFSMINHTLRRRLPLTALFDAPTVRKLAALIRNGDALETVVPIDPTGEKAPFFLVQSYLLYELSRDVVDRGRPIFGLREQSTAKSLSDLPEQVSMYVSAINRKYPEGLIHLGGWCAAAPLTVEIARALTHQGRRVGMVALFDAEAPGFVERPARGNVLLAKAGAMWRFHITRLREMPMRARWRYVLERLGQAPATLLGRFQERYMIHLIRLQTRLPWLQGASFPNRFNADGVVPVKQVQPLDLTLHLFRARDVPIIAGSDDALGWNQIARGGVEVKFIPGHHESMFLAPNVAKLRDAFQSSMLNVETQLQLRSEN